MKKLKVSKGEALQRLVQRRQELGGQYFHGKAWKDSASNDAKDIFWGSEWMQIEMIQFDTYITAEKAQVMQEGLIHAYKLIDSYIERVRNMPEEETTDYEKEYKALLKEWNDNVTHFNETSKINVRLRNEIDQVKKNTLQVDNLTLRQLGVAISHLKVSVIVGAVVAIIGTYVAVFAWGRSSVKECPPTSVTSQVAKP